MSKLGLVFSGGGGKGAYEIGVWKALIEFDMAQNVNAVSGTSVGGLNAALFVSGDYESAEALWLNMAPSKVLTLTEEYIAKTIASAALGAVIPGVAPKVLLSLTKLLGGTGYFSQKGLSQLIQQSAVTGKVSSQPLPLRVCALKATDGKLHYPQLNDLHPEDMAKWLLASAAIPVIFKSVKIDGDHYVDGGVLPSPFSDNTPYKTLIENHDCTHIINIFLDRIPDLITPQKQFPNTKFWNIVPTQAFDGLIAPLNFTSENAKKLIELGYHDVKTILEQFKAFQDDEERFLSAVFDFGKSNDRFKQQILTNQTWRGDRTSTEGSDSTQLSQLSYDQVMAKLAENISNQEQEIISNQVGRLVDEMQVNSNELLEEAFTSITTLASTKGPINSQLEQGLFNRLFGGLTGKNARMQAGVNWDLNRAIYANQQLIQKLNHKQMLTMEAMSSLSNKTNYLMDHINVLHIGTRRLDQKLGQSLTLMQQGIQALEDKCWKKFERVDKRLENLERNQLIDDWYHSSKARIKQVHSRPEAQLTMLTTSFYNQTGRQWNDNELNRYINLLDDLELAKREIKPSQLLKRENIEILLNEVDRSALLPVTPSRRAFHPLLTGAQIVSECTANDPVGEFIEKAFQFSHLNLETKRSGVELGLELLHSLRCNDKRTPDVSTSTRSVEQDASRFHGKQAEYIKIIDELLSLNAQATDNAQTAKNLSYLKSKIEAFKVIVPIIGKFSSGKSTLLNRYLGKDYLKSDIKAETAFATELAYDANERIVLNYLDGSKPKECPISVIQEICPEDNLYFVQVFIDNPKLKNRQNLILVDMPGFDSTINAHHKAIACYLGKGDVFLNLAPAGIPFDGTVIRYLQEIVFDYDKPLTCLISKAARRSPQDLAKQKETLRYSLERELGQNINIGQIESMSPNADLSDFTKALDEASHDFDKLLTHRYGLDLWQISVQLEQEVEGLIRFSTSGEAELKQQIQHSEAGFAQLKKQLQTKLANMENQLRGAGKEHLISQSRSALNNAESALIRAAKSNHLSEELAHSLRPVLQTGLQHLINEAIGQLEHDLGEINIGDAGGIQAQLQIPPEEKEKFSLTTGSIAAGIGLFLLGPLGGLVAGLIGGLLGKKDNTEERENMIREQLHGQVIPQAISQIIEKVDTQLGQAAQQLKTAVLQSFDNNLNQQKETLKKMHRELETEQHSFAERQKNLQQVSGLIKERQLQLESSINAMTNRLDEPLRRTA